MSSAQSQQPFFSLFPTESSHTCESDIPSSNTSYNNFNTADFWVGNKNTSLPMFMDFNQIAGSECLTTSFSDLPQNDFGVQEISTPWLQTPQKQLNFQPQNISTDSFLLPNDMANISSNLIRRSSENSVPMMTADMLSPVWNELPSPNSCLSAPCNHFHPNSVSSPASSMAMSQARPFKCVLPECGKSFTKLHNLKSHARIHMTVKPFKCEFCNYSFRRNHDLKRHTRLHTGVKPFQCKTCGRAFSRSDALKRHIRVEACGTTGMIPLEMTNM